MNYRFDDCSGYLTASNGTITSPLYPDNYTSNANCIYSISQPIDTIIVLTFRSMDINYSYNCHLDYLEIRDGLSAESPVLGKLCGNEIPNPIQSNQGQMWMK